MEDVCFLCDRRRETSNNVEDPRLSPSERNALCTLFNLPQFPFMGQMMKVGFCDFCKFDIRAAEKMYEKKRTFLEEEASLRSKLQNRFAHFSLDQVDHRQPSTSQVPPVLLEIRKQLAKKLQDISQGELDKVDVHRKVILVSVSTQSDPIPGRNVEVQSDITRTDIETQTMEPIPNNQPHHSFTSGTGLGSQSQIILTVDSSQQPSCSSNSSWTNSKKSLAESPQIPDTSNMSTSTLEISLTENTEDARQTSEKIASDNPDHVKNNLKCTLKESDFSSDAFNSEEPVSQSLPQPSQEHVLKVLVNDAEDLDAPLDREYFPSDEMQVGTIDINTSETPTITEPIPDQTLSNHNANSDPETDDEMNGDDTADNVDVTIIENTEVQKQSGHKKWQGPPFVSVSNDNMPYPLIKLTPISVIEKQKTKNVIKTEITPPDVNSESANEIQESGMFPIVEMGNNGDDEIVIIDEVPNSNVAENNHTKKKRGRPKKESPRKPESTAAKKMKPDIKISSGNKQPINKNKQQVSSRGRVVKKKETADE